MFDRPSSLPRLYARARAGAGGLAGESIRDLTKIELGDGFSLVVAADSDGGIGSRPGDVVRVPEYVLGRFAVRVPLIEILACGAVPIAAFDMLTVAMDELGKEIVRGVRDELTAAGLAPDFPLSGSTEDNVPTTMTGVAASVVGLVHDDDFRPGRSAAQDAVLCIGTPKSAPNDDIRLEDEEIVRPEHIQAVLSLENVHDVLPVGSRGIWYEAGEMARSAGLTFSASIPSTVDGDTSAGPSTCALVSVRGDGRSSVAEVVGVPVIEIGRVVA